MIQGRCSDQSPVARTPQRAVETGRQRGCGTRLLFDVAQGQRDAMNSPSSSCVMAACGPRAIDRPVMPGTRRAHDTFRIIC